MIIPFLDLGEGRYLDMAGGVHTPGDPDYSQAALAAAERLLEHEQEYWHAVARRGGHSLDSLIAY